jgi:fluoride exporter
MVLAVALGAAAGTPARYGMSVLWPTVAGGWPTGTFVTNLLGAFVLGLLLDGLARRGSDTGRRRLARLLFGTGFCGAFTTYSTMAVETDLLFRSHDIALGIVYGVASVVGGMLASALGILLATKTIRVVA